jgi:hypothetical protein
MLADVATVDCHTSALDVAVNMADNHGVTVGQAGVLVGCFTPKPAAKSGSGHWAVCAWPCDLSSCWGYLTRGQKPSFDGPWLRLFCFSLE